MSNVFSSWTNMRRTPYQSLTALFVVIATFFLLYVLTDLLYIGNRVLSYFETQPEIVVFFDVSVSDAQATAAADLVRALDYVDEVTVVGKNDAFETYKQENQDEPLLLGLLSSDLFPVSMSIKAKSPAGLKQVRQELSKLDGIDDIDDHESVVNEFLSWTTALRDVSILICIIFTVQFMLVIAALTMMKVAARRRTLNIMSILGASRGAIKGTFIREAFWLGTIGSLIAFGLSYWALSYAMPQLLQFFGDIPVFPLSPEYFWCQAIAGQLAAATLASLAAWISTGRLIRK
ncbi:permease-like cell division protein FtsX [bacterium]|nr:permease-like cell division protein FtsX [bacterium]